MSQDLPEPIFLSAPKAATLCGVSRNTICCWIRDGKLPSYRTAGGKYLIRPNDLISFMRGNNMFVHQSLIDISEEEERKGATPQSDVIDEDRRQTSSEPGILVVDDEPYARAMAVRTLEKLGSPVIEAENGYEAMHMLTTRPEIAVVILDLIMPGQDGVQTFKQIREQHSSIPVIIVTGNPPEDAKEVFGEMEPDLIITKPYHPSHLANATSAFMDDLGF